MAGVLVNDKILQNSSLNHLVWRVFMKYEKPCILLQAPWFQMEDLQHSKDCPTWIGLDVSKKISCQRLFVPAAESRLFWLLETPLSLFFFFSTNVRPNPNSTGLNHVLTLEPLPKRINIGKNNLLHYFPRGFYGILVGKLLYTSAKFLD